MSITIPDSVTSIEDYAFYGCTSLTSITIPNSVKTIGNDAFSHCTSLKSITIPDSVTSIEDYAFYNCASLKSITIPDSVTSIEDYAFYNCASLKSITIKDKEYICKCVDGYLFLIHSKHNTGEYTIYNGETFNRLKNDELNTSPCYVAESGEFTAHGKTMKEAVSDLQYKISVDRLAKEPIHMGDILTIDKYRAITGACKFGVQEWMEQHNIEEGLTVAELLPLLEKTNAYGYEKFKELVIK